MKLCTVCGVATSRPGSRCTLHARLSNRSRHNALYGTRGWQRLSARVLRAWRGSTGTGARATSARSSNCPCDPFRWAQLMEQWEAAGLPVLEYTTSSPSRMVPAWATFYDAVIGGGLTHDGDPRLVRHIGNMALKTDRLGPRPVKEHRGSPRSIDLDICAVGAYDRATYHAAQPATTFRSNYETEGLTFAGR